MTPLNNALPSVEEKYIRLDGTEMVVEIKVMPIIYEGKPAVQISGHDITEKKQAREEIEKNRKELKTIYDNAPVMMCVVNEKREILFSNNALNSFIDEGEKRLLLCMHDITLRREAQDALHKSEALLRAFVDNMPFGIFARDINIIGILENAKHVDEFGSILGKSSDDYKLIDKEVGEK
ncbi:PAS domain S-box protein, partial [bacterium]|nr:PAS domain S-box protein [bacterium]